MATVCYERSVMDEFLTIASQHPELSHEEVYKMLMKELFQHLNLDFNSENVPKC